MNSIKKDGSLEGKFYIAPTMNELILENKTLVAYTIENNRFHTFYTPQKIKEYENQKIESSRDKTTNK